jgi:hypothetical protein
MDPLLLRAKLLIAGKLYSRFFVPALLRMTLGVALVVMDKSKFVP